ncbi:MAG: GNAT family N-acetyltransferase [Magnetococcales bacterium]|nr:GNAT family N-acetyltransferase [Magnetococcales bacterium]
MKFNFVENNQLKEDQLLHVARLVYSAVPKFYELFGLSITELCPHIAKQIGKKNGELEHGYTLLQNNKVMGTYIAYPAREIKTRQFFGLYAMQKSLGIKLPAFNIALDDPPVDSFYLARFAVVDEAKGKGVGKTVLNHYIGAAELPLLSLHVHSSNRSAIKFYHHHGFSTQKSDNQQFYLLTRDSPS